MIDVTVKIPEDRVAELYGLVGRWLAGDLHESAVDGEGLAPEAHPAPPSEWMISEEDLALARLVWQKLSPRAVAFFSALMVEPGRRMSGEELADSLQIPNGKYGIAGVLVWPGRFCAAVNGALPCRYEAGPAGTSASHWMEPAAAQLFARARDES